MGGFSTTLTKQIDRFIGDECLFVERHFRYRRPLVCGLNRAAHNVADVKHEFTRRPADA